jgi:N-acetylglucosaminyl-diphospho-decaprenol L-rhamnosyltransferase
VITVSIVSHDQKELVLALISDIQRLKPPLIKEIILTHNSIDNRTDFPSEIGHIQVKQVHNKAKKGFGANHNSAFQLASQQFLVVLNPDLRMASDPFPDLIAAFNDQSCGLATPRVLNPDGTVANSARALYTPFEAIKGFLGVRRPTFQPRWFAGMFLVFRGTAFSAINGFDEKFFMYVEDVDICARLVLAGWSLRYQVTVNVVHDARRASRRSVRHLNWHLRSALKWWFSITFWSYMGFLLKSKKE